MDGSWGFLRWLLCPNGRRGSRGQTGEKPRCVRRARKRCTRTHVTCHSYFGGNCPEGTEEPWMDRPDGRARGWCLFVGVPSDFDCLKCATNRPTLYEFVLLRCLFFSFSFFLFLFSNNPDRRIDITFPGLGWFLPGPIHGKR